MKKIFACLVGIGAFICTGAAIAQQSKKTTKKHPPNFSNTIRLSAGDNDAGDVGRMSAAIQQVSIHYERHIFKNWFAGAGYAQWKTISTGYPYIMDGPFSSSQIEYLPDPKVGQLESRHNFKMLDLYAFYKLRDISSRRHAINIGVGISYTWGYNSYVKWYRENPEFPYDAQMQTESREASYLGFIPSVSYDYGMFHNRLIAGINYRLRYYFGMPRYQYDAGFHIGLNF